MQANKEKIESFSKNIFGLLTKSALQQYAVFTKYYCRALNFMTLSAYLYLLTYDDER
jgi:hypothetical protein